MTDAEVTEELLDRRAQYFCDKRLFSFVSRSLNRWGLMAKVTKIDSEIWFEVIHKDQ